MAKKNTPATPAEVSAAAKSSLQEKQDKIQRKADRASKRASKNLNDDRAEKKASQKQSLKSAAKQLQKELDARMNEVVSRIRKETKAKLKEVVKEATRRLDVDTERMFEQALHTIVRHYDSISGPGNGGTTNGAVVDNGPEAPAAARGRRKGQTLNKNGSPRKLRQSQPAAEATPETAATPGRRGGRPKAASDSAASPGRRPGRPKRQPAATAAPDASAPDNG